ncbi:hypothetical protein FD967_09905 [Polynucleobacter sp. JS-Mosq-20-D10]|uniref:TorF family putative porin n=1 Tax=Polynucleobacter sp. JS-Mosq-20-D10 TaxID=2576922 RepID=UPI001BFCED9B|nr:TorF family putative porin [Polynucleobacter sp. JS-Mosq-20-D10]QWE00325.1 hypothetical protein FD967_09905 [Polynucleobacter sp. JS-Mosq-20-D10]
MKTIQKTAVTLAVSSLFSAGAFAQAAPAAPEVSPVTANVTVVNNYVYRGLTQSNFKPAIQGGFDYAHESGFYVGNWNSSISWLADGYATSKVSAPVEMDFYAGFKKELIAEGFASDIGVLQYYYPAQGLPSMTIGGSAAAKNTLIASGRQALGVSPNTTELYAAQNFTFGPLTGFVKVSYAVTPLFGIYNSVGSYYPDLTANYDTGFYGITANAHLGYQAIPNSYKNAAGKSMDFSYMDWKLGVTKDFGGGLSGALAYVATTAATVGGSYIYATPQSKNQGATQYLVSLTKTF